MYRCKEKKKKKQNSFLVYIRVSLSLTRNKEQRQGVLEQDAEKNIGNQKKAKESW
jgi:hypothetical protein